MDYPTELIAKAKYELHVFERVAMDTGKELVSEVERLRAALATACERMGREAAERENWMAPAASALEWMEGAWMRIDGEWGPSGKTLDQECADGDEPEIAALRALLAPNV